MLTADESCIRPLLYFLILCSVILVGKNEDMERFKSYLQFLKYDT